MGLVKTERTCCHPTYINKRTLPPSTTILRGPLPQLTPTTLHTPNQHGLRAHPERAPEVPEEVAGAQEVAGVREVPGPQETPGVQETPPLAGGSPRRRARSIPAPKVNNGKNVERFSLGRGQDATGRARRLH